MLVIILGIVAAGAITAAWVLSVKLTAKEGERLLLREQLRYNQDIINDKCRKINSLEHDIRELKKPEKDKE